MTSPALVATQEIADLLGLGHVHVDCIAEMAAKRRIKVHLDWRGQPALTAEDAAKLIAEKRTEAETLRERSAAYAEYLRERAVKAREARIAQAREQRKELEAKKHAAFLAHGDEVAAMHATHVTIQETTDVELAGHPVSFEDFAKGKR